MDGRLEGWGERILLHRLDHHVELLVSISFPRLDFGALNVNIELTVRGATLLLESRFEVKAQPWRRASR